MDRDGVKPSVGTPAADLAPLTSMIHLGREGDITADSLWFSNAVEPHLAAMLRLARRLGRLDAEDIVQDSLARAWAKRRQYDPARGTFGAWLLAITANQAYKTWRWNLRHRDLPPQAQVGEAPRGEEYVDLERAIRHLPKRQRLAVDCFYFAGLSVSETAAVMACSVGTVKSALADARAALRESLR